MKGLGTENFQRVGCPVHHDCMVEPCLAEQEKQTVGDTHHRHERTIKTTKGNRKSMKIVRMITHQTFSSISMCFFLRF